MALIHQLQILSESANASKSNLMMCLAQMFSSCFSTPKSSARQLSDDAYSLRGRFERLDEVNYLYSGSGVAHPLPSSLDNLGGVRFRSQRSGSYHNELSCGAAEANAKAVPYFQSLFDLRSQMNYLLIAHRLQRSVQRFEIGEQIGVSADNLVALARSLRSITCRPQGALDLDAIRIALEALAFRNPVLLSWALLKSLAELLPGARKRE